jgi:hypothetical protein
MKLFQLSIAAALCASASALAAQEAKPDTPSTPEILVSANRANAPYAQENRPVIGLRRKADSITIPIIFTSDTRDFTTRRSEIETMIGSALDRAAAANLTIVTGGYDLSPVTKANVKDLPYNGAGRVDSEQVYVMVKAPLTGSPKEAEARIVAFIAKLPASGRGTVRRQGPIMLTVINPDQYRSRIITLVAQDAKEQAAIFGPDFTVQATGIDGQVFWSQISASDVFLYIPYRYTILPKK